MILKKTEMKEMPKNCLECTCKCALFNEMVLNRTQRHKDCPLINPKSIRYEAEKDTWQGVKGEIVRGQLIKSTDDIYYIAECFEVYSSFHSEADLTAFDFYEIKPETLKIVLEGEEDAEI